MVAYKLGQINYMSQRTKRTGNTKLDTSIRPSDLNVSIDEQKRLIKESELFQKISAVQDDAKEEEGSSSSADHVFNSVVLLIPSTSLFIMMDL